MAPSSPVRDEATDADPAMSRKRVRLSEESSPVDAVRIEALEPEDVSAEPVSIIHIDDNSQEEEGDGSVAAMERLGDSFRLCEGDPMEQLALVRDAVNSVEDSLSADTFLDIAGWLNAILAATPPICAQSLCDEDEAFLGAFAQTSLLILKRDKLSLEHRSPVLKQRVIHALPEFILNLMTLSVRMLTTLPENIDAKLKQALRKDSRQDDAIRKPSSPCEVPLLPFIKLPCWILNIHPKVMVNMQSKFGLPCRATKLRCLNIVQTHPDFTTSIVRSFQLVAWNISSVKDAWAFLHQASRLLETSLFSPGSRAEGIGYLMGIVEAANDPILPQICEKHPRALPRAFHEHLVDFCGDAVRRLSFGEDTTRPLGFEESFELYTRLIQCDEDFLFLDGSRSAEALAAMCHQNAALLPDLLRAAWILKAYKSFIFSSIMDIRSIGINQLRLELERWQAYNTSHHPLLQYAARFLGAHQITRYIFSADSHASIVHYSTEIVGFLAATFNYTDQETDIIWHACTTNVEADFVRASFIVLQHVCQSLDFERLLYVARKYVTTDVAVLCSGMAVETLAKVLRHLQETAIVGASQEIRLARPMLCLDILGRISEYARPSSTQLLYQEAKAEIAKVGSSPTEDRMEIYKRCASEVHSHSVKATAAIDVLAMFLTTMELPAAEGAQLLEILPLDVAIRELAAYCSEPVRTDQQAENEVHRERAMKSGFDPRIQLIVGLLTLVKDAQARQSVQDALFDHLFGKLTLVDDTRNLAWAELARVTREVPVLAQTSMDSLSYYMEHRVPSLPAEGVTSDLITLLVPPLARQLHADSSLTSLSHVLDLPLWQTLVRVGSESLVDHTASTAADALCQLLFHWPDEWMNKPAIWSLQAGFVRTYVDTLCETHARLERLVDTTEAAKFTRSINLLEKVSSMASNRASKIYLTKDHPSITLADVSKDVDTLQLFVKLSPYGTHRESRTLSVQATKHTRVSEIADALKNHTGAAENRIIMGGKILADGNQTLSEAGVQPAAVVLASPKFRFDSDIAKIFPCSSSVEEELLTQYDRLENFLLKGPPNIAPRIYSFLRTLKPSAAARVRVSSADATVAKLFPAEQPYVCAYSMAVLSRHLNDYALIGVVDPAFVTQGVHLLTGYLMDKARPSEPNLDCELTTHLLPFLRETPPVDVHDKYFHDPSGFASCLIDHLLQIVQSPHYTFVRRKLAVGCYMVLREAFLLDSNVWNAFIDDQRSFVLHARLLLDSEPDLSDEIARLIESFCREPFAPGHHVERYWELTIGICLDPALQPVRRLYAAQPFLLGNVLLHLNTNLQADESRVRALLETLVSKVQTYQHSETAEVPLPDQAFVGLLRMLRSGVTVTKAFKKPLDLGLLAEQLFQRLLFPPRMGHLPPLLSIEARAATYDLVKSLCDSPADYMVLAENALLAMEDDSCGPDAAFTQHGWRRDPFECGGLINLGMTCYMNSVIQQLFANLALRKLLFDIPIPESDGQQGMLYLVQDLFLRMQESKDCTIDTSPLVLYLGIETGTMDDVHSFYSQFMTGLEDCMPDEATKMAFSKLYTGTFISQIKGECGHISQTVASFNDIPVTVKNKASLQDGMTEFVQGEPMQGVNQYRCSTCDAENGRLVDAMKRQCLGEVPDNLTFCLKRFEYDAMGLWNSKVNDRFEFPTVIDMAAYKKEHVENPDAKVNPDLFELVGVIVHQGTVNAGHYWSYVRLGGSTDWVRLEDRKTDPWKMEETDVAWFGGAGGLKGTNGYVLFYRRSRCIAEEARLVKRPACSPIQAACMPPRVEVPPHLAHRMTDHNSFVFRIEQLFDDQFLSFMYWLITTYPGGNRALQDLETTVRISDEVERNLRGESSDIDKDEIRGNRRFDQANSATTEDRPDSPINVTVPNSTSARDLLTAVTSRYFLHLALRDTMAWQGSPSKLFLTTQAITSAQNRHGPDFVTNLLHTMLTDPDFFFNIWTGVKISDSARAEASNMIEHLLGKVKLHNSECYTDLVQRIIRALSRHLPDMMKFFACWPQYFGFLGRIACAGPIETATVLDNRFLLSALESLKTREYLLLDLSQLYNFVTTVLSSGHIELSTITAQSPPEGPHTITDGLVCLDPEEWRLLLHTHRQNGRRVWTLGQFGFAVPLGLRFEDYPPGQLLGVLSSPSVDKSVQDLMRETLLTWYDEEEHTLEPMLYMTLSYCVSRGRHDETIIELFERLADNLICWKGNSVTVMRFLHSALDIAPMATIESLPRYIVEFLTKTPPKSRRAALSLMEMVFVDPQPNVLAIARLRACRIIMARYRPILSNSYHAQEHSKALNAQCIKSLELMKWWLQDLRQNASDCDAELEPAFVAEYHQSQYTMRRLVEILDAAQDWEHDSNSFPTGTRDSIEMDASDPDMEYEEYTDTDGLEDFEDAP